MPENEHGIICAINNIKVDDFPYDFLLSSYESCNAGILQLRGMYGGKENEYIKINVKLNDSGEEIPFLLRKSDMYFVGFCNDRYAYIGKECEYKNWDGSFVGEKIMTYFNIAKAFYNNFNNNVATDMQNNSIGKYGWLFVDDAGNKSVYKDVKTCEEELRHMTFRFFTLILAEATRMETSYEAVKALYEEKNKGKWANGINGILKLENHRMTMLNWGKMLDKLGKRRGELLKYGDIEGFFNNQAYAPVNSLGQNAAGEKEKLRALGLNIL